MEAWGQLGNRSVRFMGSGKAEIVWVSVRPLTPASLSSCSISQWGWEQKLPLVTWKVVAMVATAHTQLTRGFLQGLMCVCSRKVYTILVPVGRGQGAGFSLRMHVLSTPGKLETHPCIEANLGVTQGCTY